MGVKLTTIKKLFGASDNECSYPGCDHEIIDTDQDIVVGEVCHIRGKNPDGPRYDPNMDTEEVHHFANLILLCPTHHTYIDKNVEEYPPETIEQWKATNEPVREKTVDIPDETLEELANTGHAFAKKEFEDAMEAIREDNYSAAALFVHNAKRDILDYGTVEYGHILERFDEYYEEYMEEVAKSGANMTFLRDYSTYPGRVGRNPVDDELLRDRLRKLTALEEQMSSLLGDWRAFFDNPRADRPLYDDLELNGVDIEELVCIRCGDSLLTRLGTRLEDVPGNAGLCKECLYYLLVVQHEVPVE